MSKKVLTKAETASVKAGKAFGLRPGRDDFGSFNPSVEVVEVSNSPAQPMMSNSVVECHMGDPGVFVTSCGCEDNKDV